MLRERKKRRAGFNFARWSKWCFIGALVMLLWVLWPAAQCTYDEMDSVELQTAEEREQMEQNNRSSDLTRVSSTRGFMDRFFGSVSDCYEAHPITSQEKWKQYALMGLGAVWFLFLVIHLGLKPKSYAS